MGYYTKYSLETNELEEENPLTYEGCVIPIGRITLEKHVRNITDCYSGCSFFAQKVSWWDHEENMREYSMRFPNTLFILRGLGENGISDLWVKFFKNGKMHEGKIEVTHEPFDENKLQ